MSHQGHFAASPPRRHEFLETSTGLIFAVVDDGIEDGRAICFLRYVRDEHGLRKVGTSEANDLLQLGHHEYLFHSRERDAIVHGVPLERVVKRYLPRVCARSLIESGGESHVASRCARLLTELTKHGVKMENVGVTGSLMVRAESEASDIDLVIFGHQDFQRARRAIAAAEVGRPLAPLSSGAWRVSYHRRGCELTFDEYVWHERRKNNKAMFEGTKFDISLVVEPSPLQARQSIVTKHGSARITATITEDTRAFEFPARWQIDHPSISELIACTPTYTGQAFAGETIEAAGSVEALPDGPGRLVVGDSREAKGQWLKVLATN